MDDKQQKTLLRALINTFIYFDGITKEIKSDNQKACVDHWEMGQPVFNKKYLEFANWYMFKPLTITPCRPQENLYVNLYIISAMQNQVRIHLILKSSRSY